jgi:signal peptidase I
VSAARHKWKRALAIVAAGVVVTLVAKVFVGDVYRVGSSSMEPTLFAGERVLVRFDSSPPERYELVAVRRGDEALVKRVVGVPNETIEIAGGDLVIDGERLPPDAPRPPPILVLDSRRQSIRDAFRMGSSTEEPWREVDGVWELDARDVEPYEGVGSMGLRHGLRDDVVDEQGERHAQVPAFDVGDAIVECSFRPLEPGGRIVIALDEQGDVFRFTAEITESGESLARITRHACGDVKDEQELARATISLPVGAWTRLRASNVDNHLALEREGETVLAADYDANRVHPRDEAALGRSYGERVRLGAEGARIQVDAVRVWRDQSYLPPRDPAARRPLHLGANQYYLLGDHTRSSSDSREWGAVSGDAIFGRPVWVVWPLRSIRRL